MENDKYIIEENSLGGKWGKLISPIVEIADWLFANPDKRLSEKIPDFCKKYNRSEGTIRKYAKKAQEYNTGRIMLAEKAKQEILIETAKECIKQNILTRNEALEILTKIAQGKPTNETKAPTDADRVRAIDRIAKMESWDKTDTELNSQAPKEMIIKFGDFDENNTDKV